MWMLVPTLEANAISITLEFAKKEDDLHWGLMQRRSLPKDHGMLFIYPQTRRISLWSFNCWMDFAVAFLDEKKMITEIRLLKAYPEKMDPKRPVKSLKDFHLYPAKDPILSFFQKHGIKSSVNAKYALEMPAGWFEDHNVRIGDQLMWNQETGSGFIIKK